MQSLTDNALMLRFQGGEVSAFETLYQRHRAPLYRYFLRQVARDAVDDLFQEVWMRVVRAKTRYRPVGPFKGYLYRIAHNVLVDHYRRRGRDPDPTDPIILHPQDPADQPDGAYDRAAVRARITNALAELPPEQREVFLLHREGGLTLEEIGQVVGANRETIKSRLRYANQRLRKALLSDALVSERRA